MTCFSHKYIFQLKFVHLHKKFTFYKSIYPPLLEECIKMTQQCISHPIFLFFGNKIYVKTHKKLVLKSFLETWISQKPRISAKWDQWIYFTTYIRIQKIPSTCSAGFGWVRFLYHIFSVYFYCQILFCSINYTNNLWYHKLKIEFVLILYMKGLEETFQIRYNTISRVKTCKIYGHFPENAF